MIMKKLLISFLLFCGVSNNVIFAQITLEECREAARLNYPLIVQYDLYNLAEQYKIDAINKSYLPQVSLSAKATYQSEVTKVPINIPGMTITPLDKEQYGIVLQADQIIWDGGAGRAQKEIVKASTLSESKKLDVDIYQIQERVNQIFFGILLIDENLRLSDLFLKELNRGLERVSAGEQTGLANQSDIDAVKVEILNAVQKQTELKSNRFAYLKILCAMTGKNINQDAILKVPDNFDVFSSDSNLRPELGAFDAQKNIIENQKKLIDAKNMIKVGAFVQGGYGKPGLNMLKNAFDPYYIGGIRLSWNFGGYYTRKSEISQLNLNNQIVDVQKNAFMYNLNLKNTQQLENIKKIKSLLNNDVLIIDLRNKIAAAAEAKLDNGTISVDDYLNELTKLDMARRTKSAREIEYLSAIYDYKNTLNN